MCRNLNRYPARFSYAYLAIARRHVEPFILERKVELVLGEGTWGFELLTWLVSRHHGIPMLTPSSTRIPGDRFYFGDAVTGNVFTVAEAREEDRQWSADFLRTWLNRPVQPDYMRAFRKGYKPFQAHWINELFIGLLRPKLDRGDATLWPVSARISDRTRRFVNALSADLLKPFEATHANERYVLYPLHHQPESSVDVYGSLNSNQMAVIDTASRLLPATHKLWIKEHTSALGDRSIGWYRRVLALPNVRLIDPFQDIFDLIRGADAVLTIAGTAGYEAALLGVPSLGLAPTFFAPLLTNKPLSRSHPLEWYLSDLLASPRPPLDTTVPNPRAVEFLAHLHANSYAGNPFETRVSKSRRSKPDYLAREVASFATFISGVRRRLAAQKT
jgi:hypothetical protein